MMFLSSIFRGRNYRNIDSRKLQLLLKNNRNMLIIDVRDSSDYSNGHIPGAINIPLNSISNKINTITSYRNTVVVVYCKTGVRSAQAADILYKNGFNNVYTLNGGISSYKGQITR